MTLTMERPLRFCMVTTFYPPYNFGGDGIFVHRLANELARRGHSVDVIHCVDSYRLLAGAAPPGSYDDHPNVTVHGLKSRFGALSPLATHQTGAPFLKLNRINEIMDKGFDVIHYHNISLVGGPKILAYGSAVKLYTPHEYFLICPTHLLFKYNREPCKKENCFLCLLAHKRPPQLWRCLPLIRKCAEHVDAFIHLTDFSRDIHRQKGLDLPFVHLPFFLTAEEGDFPGSDGQTDGDYPMESFFLFVGRLENLKGLQTVIPVFRRYPKAHLLVAGTGGSEADFRKLAEDCPNIRFLGHIPYGRLKGLYRRAVALIVPSLFYDISPLVIIEAFSHQTPVIARGIGGIPEIIAKSGGGLLYESDDGLLSALDQLLDNPSYRDRLGRSGFEAYTQNWTAEIHLKGYFSLISKIRAKCLDKT